MEVGRKYFILQEGASQRVVFLLALKGKKLPDYTWRLLFFVHSVGSANTRTFCSGRQRTIPGHWQRVAKGRFPKVRRTRIQSYGTIDYHVSDISNLSNGKQRSSE